MFLYKKTCNNEIRETTSERQAIHNKSQKNLFNKTSDHHIPTQFLYLKERHNMKRNLFDLWFQALIFDAKM